MFEMIMNALNEKKPLSAWQRGVMEYARELISQCKELSEYYGREPKNSAELKSWMLNGAPNWKEYSWGGCSLIYNEDIAKRLCTPSELKKTRNGERRPNSREEWLDTQERALYQAGAMIFEIYYKLKKGGLES